MDSWYTLHLASHGKDLKSASDNFLFDLQSKVNEEILRRKEEERKVRILKEIEEKGYYISATELEIEGLCCDFLTLYVDVYNHDHFTYYSSSEQQEWTDAINYNDKPWDESDWEDEWEQVGKWHNDVNGRAYKTKGKVILRLYYRKMKSLKNGDKFSIFDEFTGKVINCEVKDDKVYPENVSLEEWNNEFEIFMLFSL